MAGQHAINHLDEAGQSEPSPNVQLVAVAKAMLFPLFFVVMFALCYISAFHAPTPHDVRLALVGPTQQTSMVADQIAEQSPGAFEISATTDLAAALDDLGTQHVAGVIEVGPTVTAHIASGGGVAVSQAVERVAQPLADAFGSPLAVEDVAPLGAGDTTGMGLFYFLVVCTIGGYLTVMVLSQTAAGMPLRRRLGIVAVMSAVLTVVAFAVSTIFVGGYGATTAGLAALLLIGIAYTLAVGLVSILLDKLAGKAAIFPIMTFAIFVNFPSAGGAMPATFLPGFWQALHSFWIGSGAMQSMRSVVYFGGAGLGGGLAILVGWIAAAAALFAVLHGRGASRPASGAAAPREDELIAAQ